MVKGSGHKYRVVPCGKCPKCLLNRAKAWIYRLQQEEKRHSNSLFITLTYSNENCPISENGFMTLNKRDYQLFMKRLRKNTGRKSIKYYACGEYGTTTWRPHYHAIIFDVSMEEIDKAWDKGLTHVGDVTGDSIAYTCKYICKGKRIPLHGKDDRLKEFSLMSKNMGINYLTKQTIKWHVENKASYLLLEGGYYQPLPRYYRDKIFNEQQREEISIQSQIVHKARHNTAVRQAGSISQYYRNQQEMVIATIKNNNFKIKQERNKV